MLEQQGGSGDSGVAAIPEPDCHRLAAVERPHIIISPAARRDTLEIVEPAAREVLPMLKVPESLDMPEKLRVLEVWQ